jgi:antitoxin component YwqK of YwqJK toxin-antitoxin module
LGYDTYKDGKKDGPSIGWFGNGKKRVEVNYKDGQQQGIRRNWYENGKEKSEYTYKQGKLITATAWKINGERCIETDVVEGDGVGVLYGNDGVVKGRYTYKAGSEVSMIFYLYHPNGQKRSETFYSKGMFDGPQTYTSWNENGEKSSERTYTKGKDGPSTSRTWENGEKSSEMNYLGNKKHGSHTFWNTNGKKSAFYNYKNDNLDGLMMLWYKNGQQSSETHYKDGKPDGLSKMWYRDGEKWEKRTWVVGKLIAAVVWKPNGEKCPETKIDQKGNGVVVWYQGVGGKESSREIYKEGFRINEFKKKEKIEEHPNPPTSEYLPVPKHITGLAPIKRQRKIMKYDDGQTMWEEWWDDGTIVSARAWLPNGQQCPDTNVVNGNGVVFWYHENEKKRRRYTYKASKQDGLITHWHENGQKKTEVNYREGKQDGPVIGWYNNGQKKTEANYREGKQDGPVIGWYNNGQKRWESTFKAGKEDGLETWWYSTGQKKWEGNYKEGKLWTAIGWKPNGEKCPVTNILNGNGVIVWYEEDGAVSHRQTYKAGKIVRD